MSKVRVITYAAGACLIGLVVWGLAGSLADRGSKSIDSDGVAGEQGDARGKRSVVAVAGAGGRAEAQVDAANRLPLPAKVALIPGETVPRAANWDELIAEMTPEDRALAEVLASRYPEAYAFSSVEQLEWMIRAGYPMPQEFVLASRMSSEALSSLAETGNAKAILLAMDRWFRDELSYQQNEWIAEGAQHIRRFTDIKRSTCSPFYGFVRITFIERFYGGVDIGVFAELAHINASGDWRVLETMREMEAGGLVPAGAVALSGPLSAGIYNCDMGRLPGEF